MLVLGLDTATPTVSVAVVDGDVVRAERSESGGNRHAEVLAPLIEAVLADASVSLADLDAIAVGIGPGPFTGLRVGVVTAATLGDALAVPTYPVCSLDAIARAHAGDPLLVVTDARRKTVYWAAYAADGTRIAGPELDDASTLAARWKGEATRVVGAGALLWRDAFADGFVVDGTSPTPSAAHLCTLVEAPATNLEPLYLRRPDARPPGPPKKVTAS